jgi:branched-chain amino acid transport system ATP-binding protein
VTFFSVEGVAVRFGAIDALRGVSLTVGAGEIVGLIGPNGAGKTSLINAITGQVPTSAGRIVIDGRDITRLPAHAIAAMGISRTFQHVESFYDQTVETNLLIGLHRHLRHGFWSSALALPPARRGEAAAKAAVRDLLRAFDLEAYAQTTAVDLPFGILKRLDLARALASRPRLLLLDEPTSGMSEGETAASIAATRDHARQAGISLLVIEHNMRVIMGMADRIVVLHRGQPLATGTPAEIQANEAVIDAYLGDAPVPGAAAVLSDAPGATTDA